MANIINKKRKFCFSKKRGFSLLELMIAIFIFTVIMVSASTFFARSIKAYKNVRSVQRDLENAQFVINLMAKTLRTSSIIGSGTSYIDIYDYSQRKCIRYRFSSNAIRTNSTNPATAGDKDTCAFSDTLLANLSNIYVNNAYFSVTQSSTTPTGVPITLGKVTISLEICPSINCSGSEKDKARIQTSVSLRDYGTAGL